MSKQKLTNTESLALVVEKFQTASTGHSRGTKMKRDEAARLRKELAPLIKRRLRYTHGLKVNPDKLWIDVRAGGGLDVYLFEEVPRGRTAFDQQSYMHFFVQADGGLIVCHGYRTKRQGILKRLDARSANA